MAQESFFAIVVDGLTVERREVVQQLVKEKASGWWWHNLPDVWVVAGESAIFWRDTLRPVVAGTKSSILVLAINERGGWAGFGPDSKSRFEWFYQAFNRD
jgi:hypothetical protein